MRIDACRACCVRGLFALWLALCAAAAWAHGAPEYPISRQYNCYQNPKLPACRAAIAYGGEQAIYDWNGVNQANAAGNHMAIVPDGRLCSAGNDLFKGFDLAREDWYATPWAPAANGLYEFRYNATAPHRTSSWRFYLTRQGWSPANALRWSDLDFIAEVGAAQMLTTATSRYVMQLNVPPRTGRHVLYAIWQRSDSAEAFYSCSDVSFGGSDATTPPAPSTLQQIGQLQAREDLPVGTTVKLRVFDRNGADLERHSMTTDATNRTAAQWLARLATVTNAASASIRVGELQGGQVLVPSGKTVLQVYALSAAAGLQFAVDTVLPGSGASGATGVSTGGSTSGATGGVTPQASSGVWAEGQTFAVGQIVTHNGRQYRCLQAHTAWFGAGWRPDAVGVLNVLWSLVPGVDSTTSAPSNAWVEGQTYAAGQIVSHNGRLYRCLQGHTAWIGAGWRPDAPGVINVLWVPG